MRTFKGKISVIMPAYNEGHHIYANLRETFSVFNKSKCRFEIIPVDDGSSDNTYSEAGRAAADFGKIIPVRIPVNCGKGNALREGFKQASGDFVIFLDADLDLHPKQVYYMLGRMRDYKADIIIGSKHHPESKMNYPLMRTVFSRVYAASLKLLFGMPLRDTQTGLKIFTHESLEKVFQKVLCKRYAFDVELLANAHHAGYRVVEAPIVLDFKRGVNWGRIKHTDVMNMGIDTLAIFYRMHITKYYDSAFETERLVFRGIVE
ncbi:MAG: glycosyltransferase family 2 protein [Deltaproteobacteria bacterium]|nr:glycosyltransferase family 2 protein [Deltaproteobacteria bacterium]